MPATIVMLFGLLNVFVVVVIVVADFSYITASGSNRDSKDWKEEYAEGEEGYLETDEEE